MCSSALVKAFNPIHIPTFMCVIANWVDNFLRLFGKLYPIIHPTGKSYFDIARSLSEYSESTAKSRRSAQISANFL